MLVLSRRPGEKIVIGDDIVITLVEIRRPDQVRIGVQAPYETGIRRAELDKHSGRKPAPGGTSSSRSPRLAGSRRTP